MSDPLRPAEHFVYVTLRLEIRPDQPTILTGVVERLGSGETQAFHDAAELLGHLRAWTCEADRRPGAAPP
jgi:hypothetical protein